MVMDCSLFQLFHPLFYDSTDRTNFIHIVIEYQNQDQQFFENELSLSNVDYVLLGWAQ
jgi:hypothetical protein